VEGNPLERFGDLRKVRRVVTEGVMYDPARLWQEAGFRPVALH
jgi:hypothetical protein